MWIYKITNIQNNKVYIGQTCQSCTKRFGKKGAGYDKSPHFYAAIQKYGWDNFEHLIILSGVTKEEAEQKEIELIKKYNSVNPQKGYNIENGGNCMGTHSEETKLKISIAQRGEKNHAFGKPSPTKGRKA